ncbi:glycoside hydrolase family 73 protein [Paludibacterium paludis]|uniref:Mannosyl-glycoprotein endo-beta-N-acetylglucosamidase-like domain-containing protein n=1 Tax=Paludibacterium paludis TaxID=1225769 RepID=A0A918NXE3_9NEIS|nr:glucosaminidase domain-containing protein [Paludibacterium paludis]GGY04707.1 hypothetical protein GCM10011289_04050 [Paludibacterium paludis]
MIDFPALGNDVVSAREFPPLPQDGGGAGFGALMRETRQDVERFITSGEGWGGAASGLSPEARAAMLRAGQAPSTGAAGALPEDARAFLDQIMPFARDAGRRLGVAADIIAAHAALESGWGGKPLRDRDGKNRYNLFGIKADAGWQGDSELAATREHGAGGDYATSARFRAYGSLAEGFDDYARFLGANPRYRGALGAGSDAGAFARGLARAGYATDPAYADKLMATVARIRDMARAR